MATYQYATNDRVNNLEPLSVEMENTLNRKVTIHSYPTVDSLIKGITANEVDVAFINTLGYLTLFQEKQIMKPVASFKIKEDAINNYKSVLLSNNDSITRLVDIIDNAKNLSISLVKKGSTSGNFIPRVLFKSLHLKSLEEEFKSVSYAGNHTANFEKLLEKKVDLCTIGSNEYFKQIENDSTLKHQVKLVWISGEIPLGPVLVNNNLEEIEKEKITRTLLQLHYNNVKAFERIKSGWSEAKQADRFHHVSQEYYNAFFAQFNIGNDQEVF
ncbi:hypothetical protein GCM10022258_30630 [Aquimarina gracilis]